MTSTSIALFTRDLRVHDNPTLSAAVAAADVVVPLFVLDHAILGSDLNSPNRAAFLADSLNDLDASLKRLGAAGLIVRHGDVSEQTAQVVREAGADQVHLSGDWSRYARTRQQLLERRLAELGGALYVHPETIAVVPPGSVRPAGRDHFAVFTPYHRRWERQRRRAVLQPPRAVRSPRVRKGSLPSADDICAGRRAPDLPDGGESAGRRRLITWLDSQVRGYAEGHDDLAGDRTSRLSPYLHLGCLSPLEVVARAGRSAGGEAFVRQIAWRDFHLQVLAARPDAATGDYRGHGDRWRDPGGDYDAWREGRTGIPIVDAAMRQLLREGWMHNRGRLVVGSFLTKHLYIDWRAGASHFLAHLVDGDVANNQLNWQWVAGTGTDTRPNRVLNPLRQAERYDPDGDYVRRYVDELSSVSGPDVHRPWTLPESRLATLDYPAPLVDLDQARRAFLDARKTG